MSKFKVKKHTDRPDLIGEHPMGDLGQLILLVLFIILGIVDFFLISLTEPEYIEIPYIIWIIIGSIVLAFGFYYAKTSLKIIFGTKREKAVVINENIYTKVRHPMYLGAKLFYFGASIIMFSLPLFILSILIFLFYDFIAKHEEKLLLEKFGNDYKNYMNKVRRWIPKF